MKWVKRLSAVKIPRGNLAVHSSLPPWYLFQATSRSSFPLTTPSPGPKLLNTRLNPKPNTTRQTRSIHLRDKRHQTWFSAKRKGEYLMLPFRSQSFSLFLCLYKLLLCGEDAKRRVSIVFQWARSYSEKASWSARAPVLFHMLLVKEECRLLPWMLFIWWDGAKGGKAAI